MNIKATVHIYELFLKVNLLNRSVYVKKLTIKKERNKYLVSDKISSGSLSLCGISTKYINNISQPATKYSPILKPKMYSPANDLVKTINSMKVVKIKLLIIFI
jgi:hypothetical protein